MFGDLDSVSFIKINRLKWSDHVDTDRIPKISSIISQREIDSEVDPGIVDGTVCKLI